MLNGTTPKIQHRKRGSQKENQEEDAAVGKIAADAKTNGVIDITNVAVEAFVPVTLINAQYLDLSLDMMISQI